MAGRLRFWEVGAEGDDAALLRNEEVNEKAYEEEVCIDAVTSGDRGQRGPPSSSPIHHHQSLAHSRAFGAVSPKNDFFETD